MNRTLVWDMDGTIADLYGVTDWLPKLMAEDASPYVDANSLYDMDIINALLNEFRACGWRIVVTTWLAKGSTRNYDRKVRKAKIDWLARMGFRYDEIHLVKYGTTKANCTRKLGGYQVLIDDNEKVRKGWTLGDTIDPTKNLIENLVMLLDKVA